MENTTPATDTVATPAKGHNGTWQETLTQSAHLFERAGKSRKRASELLWQGAQAGIESWMPNSDTDVSAESFGQEVTDLLGKARKGDASKIKTVALAVRNHGLILAMHPNLSKAYAEARRLTQTVIAENAEDEAADKAAQEAKKSAPNSTTTPEGAALMLAALGVDEVARLLLDAFGPDNEKAHRSLLRAVSQEIAGRVKAKVPPKKVASGPKSGGVKQATKAQGSKPKAEVKSGATKAKPVSATPAVPVKAKPVARPVVKAKPVKASA